MIGISVSDIIKLLEQVPGWKAVAGLPKRLADLEARVAAIEKGQRRPDSTPGPRDCPKCGAVMAIVGEHDDRKLMAAGVKIHEMKCDNCGNEAERKFRPGHGYM